MVTQMFKGDVGAAREIRAATEGEGIFLRTWRDDVIKFLQDGQVTPETVRLELGDEIAGELIIAAGLPTSESGEVEAGSGEDFASPAIFDATSTRPAS